MTKPFKELFTLEERQREIGRLMARGDLKKYYPLIIEPGTDDIKILEKRKYLIPHDCPMTSVILIIRRALQLKAHQATFLTVTDPHSGSIALPKNTEDVATLYSKYKDPDGFLYINYSMENFFG
jgi:GABA(A) receptor-associated protein